MSADSHCAIRLHVQPDSLKTCTYCEGTVPIKLLKLSHINLRSHAHGHTKRSKKYTQVAPPVLSAPTTQAPPRIIISGSSSPTTHPIDVETGSGRGPDSRLLAIWIFFISGRANS
jgi:hypothetical protein